MMKPVALFLCMFSSLFLFCEDIVSAEQGRDCDISTGSCSIRAGGGEVILDINPKPVNSMTRLSFAVEIKGLDAPDSLKIDLAMPGMYMGKNEVTVTRTASGKFIGEGILPRCASGGTLWQARIPVGDRENAIFRFHVTH